MAEFTGERLIPGQVDIDLLNEHVARYADSLAPESASRARDDRHGCSTRHVRFVLLHSRCAVELHAGWFPRNSEPGRWPRR